MRAALSLASRGLGRVAPNPSVGCIIVRDGRIVGRGFTQPGGRPHGETQALAMAGTTARGATVYVTLEPCSHHGKTPPCAEALVSAGVDRVVIATGDPDERVSGRGIKMLRDAGIQVETGLLAEEARRMNAGFLSRITAGRPFVTLKLAITIDGRIAAHNGRSKWITGPDARHAAHMMRAEHDAIAVGIGTVLADDPDLTCRIPGLEDRSPQRIVFDSGSRLPADARLRDVSRVPTLVLTTTDIPSEDGKEGPEFCTVSANADGNGISISAALTLLAERGITRLMVEGGAGLATSFLKAGLVDELAVFTAPMLLGGDAMPVFGALGLDDPGAADRFTPRKTVPLGSDSLTLYSR
jgi:diaminohydroxyphosphoribosylaminopyrimidine deaminase/5-amino-6-(5-phosphoribosylamino)uracil reductase